MGGGGIAFLYLFQNTNNAYSSIMNNSNATLSLKTLHPGGIWTRVFYSRGRCDVHCASPPGQLQTYLKVDCVQILQIGQSKGGKLSVKF
jgi:hypothetical protein